MSGWLSGWLGGSEETDGQPRLYSAKDDPDSVRLRTYLIEGKHAEIESFLNELKDPNDASFHCLGISEWPERPATLDRWCSEFPQSPWAFTVRGWHSFSWAWEARGRGFSDSVTDDRAELFFQRLEMAQEDFDQAFLRAPKRTAPLDGLIAVHRGLGQPDQAREAFNASLEREPDDRTAHVQMLMTLAGRWGGEPGQMMQFARDRAAAAPPGSSLHLLPVLALIEQVVDSGNPVWGSLKEHRQTIIDSFVNSVGSPCYRRNKLSLADDNTLAFALGMAGVTTLAHGLFQQIAGRIYALPWGYAGASLEIYARVQKTNSAVAP